MLLIALLLSFCIFSNARNPEVVGYLENWNDVKWWDSTIPGNCAMGCMVPKTLMQKIKSYTVVNYGFTFLTENPDPGQIKCNATSCPVWDGKAIYAAAAVKQGSKVVTSSTNVNSYTPGLISIGEVCRLVRQGPYGPKRCKITLGGWSDWARIGNTANAQAIAKLVAKMVLLSFADGVDLDFEHLSEYSKMYTDEFGPFTDLIKAISSEFDLIKPQWVSTANKRMQNLIKTKNNAPYYKTNIHYLKQVAANGPPEFEISWTTRFNAFIDPNAPFNIYEPSSPHPKVPFLTDNEGAKIWPKSGQYLGSANIMAYDAGSDAGPLILNFEQILDNFKTIGNVNASKVNMGFEPGKEFGGGHWEGLDRDMNVSHYVNDNRFGGIMVWAINPNAKSANESAHWAPILAEAVNKNLNPVWPYGDAPVYDKCNPSSGWWSA